jgi:hypothetical protein
MVPDEPSQVAFSFVFDPESQHAEKKRYSIVQLQLRNGLSGGSGALGQRNLTDYADDASRRKVERPVSPKAWTCSSSKHP